MKRSFAAMDIESGGNYIKSLRAVAKLSRLFNEGFVPFINYRVVENIFCTSFNAENLSRSDTAFDAKYNSLGVGLKTFICSSNNSTEKIAEFNAISKDLNSLRGGELAIRLAQARNNRIDFANRLYGIKDSLYHIVARKHNELILFETGYEKIDINNICSVKQRDASLQFEDGRNSYIFNHSKSTLFKRFFIPETAHRVPIEILEDPYKLLLDLLENTSSNIVTKDKDYVILPLYGMKNGQKYVFEKSGLNQWNASGRKRDMGEVYIPIPAQIHKHFPNFFPKRDLPFNLQIPTGEVFSAKVCQDNSKALMTNPNKALSDWILRKVFQVKEGEILTIELMRKLSFDSVILIKEDETTFRIDKAQFGSYETFMLAR